MTAATAQTAPVPARTPAISDQEIAERQAASAARRKARRDAMPQPDASNESYDPKRIKFIHFRNMMHIWIDSEFRRTDDPDVRGGATIAIELIDNNTIHAAIALVNPDPIKIPIHTSVQDGGEESYKLVYDNFSRRQGRREALKHLAAMDSHTLTLNIESMKLQMKDIFSIFLNGHVIHSKDDNLDKVRSLAESMISGVSDSFELIDFKNEYVNGTVVGLFTKKFHRLQDMLPYHLIHKK